LRREHVAGDVVRREHPDTVNLLDGLPMEPAFGEDGTQLKTKIRVFKRAIL